MAMQDRNNMVPERVSDIGLARFSLENYCSAVVVFNAFGEGGASAPWPAYSLLGRSIELGLKSLLRRDGLEPRQMKDLGHALVKILKKVETNDLHRASRMGLTSQDRELLKDFSEAYAGKDYEYFGRGVCIAPAFHDIARLAKAICGFAVKESNPLLLRGVWSEVFMSDLPSPPRPLSVREARDHLAAIFAAELAADGQ